MDELTADDLVSIHNRAGGGWRGFRAIASLVAQREAEWKPRPRCPHDYGPGDHHYEGGCRVSGKERGE